MARQRRFKPDALLPYASSDIKPPLGIGALVWRYLTLVPLEETAPGQESVPVAEMEDVENLRAMLSDHFGGVTVLQPLMGFGLRQEGNPDSLELNRNLPFVVYAKPIASSDRYFSMLQAELQQALGQGLNSSRTSGSIINRRLLDARPLAIPGPPSFPLPPNGGRASGPQD